MSTIRVSNIQDTSGGNSSTPAAIANGVAKAWVQFIGTGTVTTKGSYNVSSITDRGVGLYTVNFTTALSDENYALIGTTNRDTGAQANIFGPDGTTALTSTSAAVQNENDGGTAIDAYYVSVAVFR